MRRVALRRRLPAVLTAIAVTLSTAYLPATAAADSAAPTGDLPGWRHVYTDDFTGGRLDTVRWTAYAGTPGGDPGSWWDPGQVSVRDGLLVLQGSRSGDRLVTGGVSNWPNAQLYGKWEVRVRADPSDEVTYHLLLWPKDESWPPEVDFAENFGGDRSSISAFLHWRDGQGNAQKREQVLPGDFTQWQTLGVEWLPGEIRYTINGQVWGTETGADVPSTPMWLGIQAQADGCAKAVADGQAPCPWVGTPDTTNVEVDWVAVYQPITDQ